MVGTQTRKRFWFFEFVDQYEETVANGPFMGIGVAVPKETLEISSLPEALKQARV